MTIRKASATSGPLIAMKLKTTKAKISVTLPSIGDKNAFVKFLLNRNVLLCFAFVTNFIIT